MKASPQYYDVTVGAIEDFGNDTREYELRFDPGKSMEFIPGQFAAVLCPKERKIIRRAYSIASPPSQKQHLDLIIKLVQGGVVTNWFWTLKTGDRFRVHGPLGKFILPERIDFEIVFVATGTGIAPFRSMIHQMLRDGFQGKMDLLFGTRYENMIPYHAEWLELSRKHPNLRYLPTISRPSPEWKGEAGYVQTKIEKFFPNPDGKRVYICGLNEMIQGVQEACQKRGYRKEQISCEKYD